MILVLTPERAHNLRQISKLDIRETWDFRTCMVAETSKGFTVLMLEAIDGMTLRVLGRPITPRESARDFRAKLSDGADPTEFDVCEEGIVSEDMLIPIAVEYGRWA